MDSERAGEEAKRQTVRTEEKRRRNEGKAVSGVEAGRCNTWMRSETNGLEWL